MTSGNNFPDALAGSVLSKKLNAPILLVNQDDSNNIESIEYIKKHLNSNGTIYILGGESSVSDSFIDYIKVLRYKNIERLGGVNRFATNEAIVESMNISKGTPVVIVNGYGFADALSVSSIAASNGYPILMSNAESLPDENIQPNKVYVIGGQGSLSDTVVDQVKQAATTITDSSIVRIGGVSRYDTSLKICKEFKINTNTAVISNGENFPDALSGSALAAKSNAPIILTDGNNILEQKSFLDTTKYTNLILLGGQGAVSKDVEDILNGVQPTTSVGISELTPYNKTEDDKYNGYNYLRVGDNTWSNGNKFTIRQTAQPRYTNMILGYSYYECNLDNENDESNYYYTKYVLDKKYDSITGTFAVDDMTNAKYTGKVRTLIYGDDEKLYQSDYLKRGNDPINVNVNLKGKRYVTIKFDAENDSSYSNAEIYFAFMDVVLNKLKTN